MTFRWSRGSGGGGGSSAPKPLLIKSPVHTARVALLLRLFPRARFVYVHRDPLTTFASAAHMANTYYWWACWRARHALPNAASTSRHPAARRAVLPSSLPSVCLVAHVFPCPPACPRRYCYLQQPSEADVTDFVLDQFDLLHQTYLQDRNLIPPGACLAARQGQVAAAPTYTRPGGPHSLPLAFCWLSSPSAQLCNYGLCPCVALAAPSRPPGGGVVC